MDLKQRTEAFRSRVRSTQKPKPWFPETEGDMITGIVKNFRKVTSRFGDAEVIDLEDDETGELRSVFCSSVIQSEREKQEIQIGERVGIKYIGDTDGENATYKNFIVMVERPEKETT